MGKLRSSFDNPCEIMRIRDRDTWPTPDVMQYPSTSTLPKTSAAKNAQVKDVFFSAIVPTELALITVQLTA